MTRTIKALLKSEVDINSIGSITGFIQPWEALDCLVEVLKDYTHDSIISGKSRFYEHLIDSMKHAIEYLHIPLFNSLLVNLRSLISNDRISNNPYNCIFKGINELLELAEKTDNQYIINALKEFQGLRSTDIKVINKNGTKELCEPALD